MNVMINLKGHKRLPPNYAVSALIQGQGFQCSALHSHGSVKSVFCHCTQSFGPWKSENQTVLFTLT